MSHIKKGIKLTIAMIIICGLIYPLFITGIGQLFFSHEANGSVIEIDGREVGSELIGQNYNKDIYFSGRISAVDYNTSKDKKEIDATSGSQNLGPTSNELKERVSKDIDEFIKRNPEVSKDEISSELISQSGSGLDPDITPSGALIQIPRIEKATGIPKEKLEAIVKENTKGKWLGLYGADRVNVLRLNIAIDDILTNNE